MVLADNELIKRKGLILMKYQKNMTGYYVDVESLDYTKDYSYFREAAKKLQGIFNKYLETVTLRYDGLELEDYNAWLSDGPNGLAGKLQEWSRINPYYTYELDDNQKEDYINRAIENFVHNVSYDWLQETLEDKMNTYGCETEEELYEVFNFYNDTSLSEIVTYLWGMFQDYNTMYHIDNVIDNTLGYYGDSMIAKIPGEGYYLFFH